MKTNTSLTNNYMITAITIQQPGYYYKTHILRRYYALLDV